MTIVKNKIYTGSNNRLSVYDLFYNKNKIQKKVLIFCHGFKGFKDHGCFDLMAKWFAEKNFVFIKFNFSHNGGTIENPIDFPDLEAFSNNTYTKELYDLNVILDELFAFKYINEQEIDLQNIALIGHSRGGGISILKAQQDARISHLITLGAVSTLNRFPEGEKLKLWKKEGITYIENLRTHQQMPLKYDLYKNYIENKEILDIKKSAENLNKPYLILHGMEDETVDFQEAIVLNSWCKTATLFSLENANHAFGSSHPWEKEHLPVDFKKALETIISFIS